MSDLEELTGLLQKGLSAAEAIDYYAVEVREGHTQSSWATERGKSQQAISKNVRQAKAKLEE